MSEFAKRLVTERERLGLTPTASGSQAGVGVRMQAQFEGARQPPLSYMLRLSEMGVDVLYLLTGRRCNSLPELSEREQFLLENYRACDDRAKQHVLDTVTLLSR